MAIALKQARFRLHRTPTSLQFEDEFGRDLSVVLNENHFWVVSLRTQFRYPVTREGARRASARMHDRLGHLARTALRRRAKLSDDERAALRRDERFQVLGWRTAFYLFQETFVDGLPETFPELSALFGVLQREREYLSPLLASAAFRANPWVLDDMLRFRAARVALCYAEPRTHHLSLYSDRERELVAAEQVVRWLTRWRDLYAPDRKSYRALNQTLERFDAHIDGSWFQQLRRFRLPCAVRSWTHFELTHELFRIRRFRDEPQLPLLDQLLHSEEHALQTCIQMVHDGLFRGAPASREAALHTLMEMLVRGAPPRRMSWLRFVEREVNRLLVHERRGVAPDQPCARPPIALPNAPGVRFLPRVADLVEEGRVMNHCVAIYSPAAVDGRCFLFHVEHEGEHATVEVSHSGQVRQSKGPKNQRNVAAEYGRRVLSEWGRAFRTTRAEAGAS